jgi:N-acetylglucosamine kinase-like BadF-type ATPase
MTYFLGVDGGQSGTTALIGDENGLVLGSGEAGPCNHVGAHEGRAKLERAVMASVAGACAQAGGAEGNLDAATIQFESACFGMSGGPEEKEAILASILRVNRLTVTNDAVIALAGATETGQGIITIAGTGSIAFGRNAELRSVRAGGWGYLFGDEGGAFDIVRQALRAALRMEEGWGTHTSLRDVILKATDSRGAHEAMHRMYTADWPRDRTAQLAPLVDDAAVAGDAVANEILTNAGRQLAMLAGSVRSQLWKPGNAVEIAYIGGVFQSRIVLERFRMLAELQEGVRCIMPKHGPTEGALIEAYRSAGVKPVTLRFADGKSKPTN